MVFYLVEGEGNRYKGMTNKPSLPDFTIWLIWFIKGSLTPTVKGLAK
jgi:hypothetical protein